MKFFIIACEPSGDLHGAHLIEEIKKIESGAEFRGLGGPRMAAAGAHLLQDMTQMSALGLGDVVRQYLKYRKIFYRALDDVNRYRPDAVIVLDSPAFNLRFAKKIQRRFPFIYYISPQIWAWGGRRIHTIKKTVSKMLVLFPFEKTLYEKAGVPCEFVGHPLLDTARASASREELRARFEILPHEKAVGLMPGSREKEVRRILPPMLESAALLKKIKSETIFFLSMAPNISEKIYDEILNTYPLLKVRRMKSAMYDLTTAMDFALIASGTATLEAALLGTPFFLLYKASWTTYVLGKQLIRVQYLGLANLLAGKRVVPEFIQNDIHPETIAHEAKVLLENPELYQHMKEEFLNVRNILGEKGASRRAAEAVLKFISSRRHCERSEAT
jgi:lipid-A-disaccharide synthase